MESALERIQSGYSAMSQGTENMTPAARAAQAENIITQTRSLRAGLNSRYMAGQQAAVNDMNRALDAIETALQGYVNGAASSATAAPGNMLGGAAAAAGSAEPQGTEQLRRQIQEAIEQGLAQYRGGEAAQWKGPTAEPWTGVLPVLGAEALRDGGKPEAGRPLDVLEQDKAAPKTGAAGQGLEPLRVGRATTIKRPYQGPKPVQIPKNAAAVQVDSGSVRAAQNRIDGAKGLAETPFGEAGGFKATLKKVLQEAFHPVRGVEVEGVTFDGKPYLVDINNKVVGKVINDKNLSAEKIALLDVLPDVVHNGEYVGSGEYIQHGSKKKLTIRFDYYETLVAINGKSYIASFDVEVFPNTNSYRTHKLHEIELSPITNADVGPAPTASVTETALVEGTRPLNSDLTIAQGADSVKFQETDPFVQAILDSLKPAETTRPLDVLEQEVRRLYGEAAPEAGAGKPRIKLEDFVNNDSPIWNNLEYEDFEVQAAITRQVHDEMVSAGEVVRIPESTIEQTAEAYPDLREMKKAERVSILREKMSQLKSSLRQFLNGLKGTSFEFEVNGNVLEARLYNTGIREVLEKISQDKASMLYHSDEIFRTAKYLYSTPDYDGDPNVYRWNYFYTPVQIGDETVGVRIAVRDVGTPAESQIYNWGIKKDILLDGDGRGKNRIPTDVSSSTSFGGTRPPVSDITQRSGTVKPQETDPFVQAILNSLKPAETSRPLDVLEQEVRRLYGKKEAPAEADLRELYIAALQSRLAQPGTAWDWRAEVEAPALYQEYLRRVYGVEPTVPLLPERSGGEWDSPADIGGSALVPMFADGIEMGLGGSETGQGAVETGESGAELEIPVENPLKSDIIEPKLRSGALNPESGRARVHAERYYQAVRKMTADVRRIAENTGYPMAEIQKIKSFIFLDEHDLGDGKIACFDASFEMAQSWQRLIDGKNIQPHDMTLLRHEIMERELMDAGYTQDEAHTITSRMYNYAKEAYKYYYG